MIVVTSALDPVLLLAVRASLALLFASSAFHKVVAPGQFRSAVQAYRLIPSRLVGITAMTIIAFEAVLAPALLLAPSSRPAAIGAVLLLLLYTIAIGVNLLRGRSDLDCGCYGSARRQTLHPLLLVRNATLLLGAVLATAPSAPRTLVWFDGVSLAAAIAAAVLIWHAANGLLSLGAGTRAARSHA
jgi:hypothetical protein